MIFQPLVRSKDQKSRGFTLLEMALALGILVILMVATVQVVKNEREFSQMAKNEVYMKDVQEALMTFLKVNRFLPCPDSDGDGKENRQAVAPFECTEAEGQIPFLDLGVAQEDAWHQPLFYAVNARADRNGILDIWNPLASASYFNNQGAPVFGLNTRPFGGSASGRGGAGNYRVCGERTPVAMGCSATTGNGFFLEEFAIAVVVSFGQNGAATWNAINTNTNAGLGEAETENMDRDQNYWLATGSQREGQSFDDQLFWILNSDVNYAILSSGGTLATFPEPP